MANYFGENLDIDGRISMPDPALYLNSLNNARELSSIARELMLGLLTTEGKLSEVKALAISRGFKNPQAEASVQGMGQMRKGRGSIASGGALVPFRFKGGATLAVMPSEPLQPSNAQASGAGGLFRFNPHHSRAMKK
jgi:hypothetical protein